MTKSKRDLTGSPKRLLDYDELAYYLGLGRTTVINLVNDGEIPKTPIGHRVLFDRVDVDAYIERVKRAS